MKSAQTSPPGSRKGLPLVWRIIGWLCVNLLLLGLVFGVVLQGQFHFGLESLLAGPAGERVNALTSAIVSTLRQSPREQWDAALEGFSKAYAIDITLVAPDGGHIAGKGRDLPEEVLARFGPRLPDGERLRMGLPLGKGPPQGRGPRREMEPRVPPAPGPPLPPRFALRTDDPRLYWVGIRVPPIREPDDARVRLQPWTMLLATKSIYSGGLFLDIRLWVIAALGTLVLSALLWLPLVRGITKSISQLTSATDEIANGNFAVRVPSERTDELGQLGLSVNRMASRLDGFVKGQKRFLGDIAHELCSPLARMEVALGILEEETTDNSRDRLSEVREEVREMSALINELLSFSKASLAEQKATLEAVPLETLACEVLKRENPSGQGVDLNIPTGLQVLGRADLLRRALANLVRNALRYAGTAGPISISAEEDDRHVRLAVRDMGPGVPSGDVERIFDPFYRTEQSRSRESGGSGLGLAIVKTCVEACGGHVEARNVEPRGFEVLLTLRRPS